MPTPPNKLVEQQTTIGGFTANYIEFDRTARNSKNPLILNAANGFPIGAHHSFIEPFTDKYHVSGLEGRGMWPEPGQPKNQTNWQHYANYLIEFLEQTNRRSGVNQKFTGIGHSLGGSVTLIAAIKRPDLFRKLVIIEPATTPSRVTGFVWQYLPKIAERSLPLVSRTLLRRKHWPNKAEFIRYHSSKPAFKKCTVQAMQDYAEYGLRKNPDSSYTLAYSIEWEAHNFRQVHYSLGLLGKIKVPTLLITGATSYFYSAYVAKQRMIEKHQYLNLKILKNTAHLVPFENPAGAQKCILDWL